MSVDILKELTGEDGRIDLDKVANRMLTNGIAATAWYTEGWYELPGNNICLMKKMLSFLGEYPRENAKFQPEEYNAMLCQALAEIFGLPTAKYYMAKRSGTEYMLTPNFLKKGEELIHVARIKETVTGEKQATTAIQGSSEKISEMYKYLEEYLRNYRYKGKCLEEKTIKNVLFDFLKQRFFSRFVQNTDEHLFNMAIVVKGENVRMSDMYDYDFTLARRTTDVVPGCEWQGKENEIVLDNGESNVTSFIRQYANYPGMREFLEQCIASYSLDKLEGIIFANTGIGIDKKEAEKHYKIIEANMRAVKSVINEVYYKEEKKGDER